MSEKDEKSIEEAMVDSLAIDKVGDLVGDIAEVGLDTISENGLLKDIPLIGMVAKSVGAAFAIRDRIFAKKVLRFLAQLDDIPKQKKQKFVDNLKDDKQGQQVGETLIILLDRLDDIDKATLLGRLFGAYIQDKISYDDFRRLSMIVDRVFVNDLQLLLNEFERSEQGRLTQQGTFVHEELSSIGLLARPSALVLEQSAYHLTDFAKKLVEYAIIKKPEENDS